jgi:hypothetical protein
MRSILKSSCITSSVTALYFIPEIIQYSESRISLFVGGFIVQALHDAVCIFFFLLFVSSFRARTCLYLAYLNCLHGIIMMLFCYYKRCILTLIYNHMMGIEMCQRYIPIWQRFYNVVSLDHQTCHNDYRNTYLWLNNHILQSLLVFISNVYHLVFIYRS